MRQVSFGLYFYSHVVGRSQVSFFIFDRKVVPQSVSSSKLVYAGGQVAFFYPKFQIGGVEVFVYYGRSRTVYDTYLEYEVDRVGPTIVVGSYQSFVRPRAGSFPIVV